MISILRPSIWPLLEWAASLKLFAYSRIGLAIFFPGHCTWTRSARHAAGGSGPDLKLAIGGAVLALIETIVRPRCGSSAYPNSSPARSAAVIGISCTSCWEPRPRCSLVTQFINLFAAVLLLLSFGLLAQRRVAVADPSLHAAGSRAGGFDDNDGYFTAPAAPVLVRAITLVLKVS